MLDVVEAYFLAKSYANDCLSVRNIYRRGIETADAWLFIPIGMKNKKCMIAVFKETGEVSIFGESEYQEKLKNAKSFRLCDKDVILGEPPRRPRWIIIGSVFIFVLAISIGTLKEKR